MLINTNNYEIFKRFLNEKYKLIPEVVKDAMGSVDRANLIRSIAEKYKLHIDQTGLLFEEIIYVTLGVEKQATLSGI